MSRQFGTPVCDILIGYFDEQARRLTKNYHLSLAAVTTDSIHDLRVAVKRIRALFQLAEWIDNRFDARRTFKPIRKLFKAAGPVRDNHVQQGICRRLSRTHELDLSGFLNYLLERDLAFRAKYLAGAERFELSILSDSKAAIENMLRKSSDDELLFRMGQKLALQIAEVISLTNHSQLTNEQRHQIRIATKAVRYTLEVRRMSPLADASLDDLNIRLRSCHQTLGRWHDYQVGCVWLTDYLKNQIDGPLVAADDYVAFARVMKNEVNASLHAFEEAWIDLRDFVRGPQFSIN